MKVSFIIDVLYVCAKVRLSIYSVFSILKAIRVTQIINKKKKLQYLPQQGKDIMEAAFCFLGSITLNKQVDKHKLLPPFPSNLQQKSTNSQFLLRQSHVSTVFYVKYNIQRKIKIFHLKQMFCCFF